MSPFQESHQPAHAGQPAGALNFAPDEEPVASAFDREGQDFDSTLSDAWMDPLGVWDADFAFQSAFEPALNDQAMLPPFYAEGDLLDYSLNNWTTENLEFGRGAASQSALGPALNGTMPPFDAFGSNPWMDPPIGLSDAEDASTSALFSLGQAPIASDGGPSYLQDASFDCFYPADEEAGIGGFADPVR
jgi:hypothetical protein